MDSSVGGSLSVICNYSKGYEKNAKFWCKVEPSFFLDRCPILIESGSKDETRQGNIYIKDNKEKHYFEVTMDNLRMEDSGIYKCGIYRKMRLDLKHKVTVNVMFTVPEERLPTTKPEERPPTTKPEDRLPTTKPEDMLPTTKQKERVSATKHPDPDPPIKGTVKSNPSPAHTGPRNSQLYILIYSSIPLLALLLTIVVVAVVSRCKKTGSCLVRKKERQVSNMALEKREEVSYATLAFSDQREQALYDNVAPHGHALPQPQTQELGQNMTLVRILSILVCVQFPGVTCSVSGPSEQTGFLGRSLSVTCTYDQSYRNFVKYWCQGARWSSCQTVVKTRGTEAEVKAQRTSIKDDHTRFQFTVRMEDLTEQDAGGYWCAIERPGSDRGTLVTITVLPDPGVAERPGELSTPGPDLMEAPCGSTVYQIRVSFLVLIGLKMTILLCLSFAIIWMHRRSRHGHGSLNCATRSC